LLACIAAIYPTFGLLDWLVYPSWVGTFLSFRALIALSALALLRMGRRVGGPLLVRQTLLLAVVATAGIAAMCAMTEGYASRYLVGVILCCLGIATVDVAEPRTLATLLGAVCCLYAALNAAVPVEHSQIVSSLAFLIGALFFCLLCSALLEEQRRRLFAANTELLARNLELQRAKEQQGKFLSTISHELRSPINSVLGFAELIIDREPQLQRKSLENLRRIQLSGGHLLRLVNDLLDLAKAEAGHMEIENSAFDMVPLLQDIAEQTRGLVRDRAIQVSVLAPEQCLIRSDAARMRQILVNLTSNAAKFTASGEIQLRARRDGGGLVIEVSDTGIGIAEQDRSSIFDTFRQAHRGMASGGTGLGLNIVSQLAALLGGRVEVESEVGRGSLFRVRFEAALERSAA
jgi:signal transduction histidine kinase